MKMIKQVLIYFLGNWIVKQHEYALKYSFLQMYYRRRLSIGEIISRGNLPNTDVYCDAIANFVHRNPPDIITRAMPYKRTVLTHVKFMIANKLCTLFDYQFEIDILKF